MKKFFLFAAAVVAAMTINAADAVWNFSEWETSTGFTNQVKNNLGLYACDPSAKTQITNFGVIEANSKKFDDNFEGTQRFKLNGAGYPSEPGFVTTPVQRFVYFDVEGNSLIKVWFLTGGSGERTLFITDGVNKIAELAHDGSSDKLILEGEYTGGATKIFIYGSSACNLYKIEATNVGTTTEFSPAMGVENIFEESNNAVKFIHNGQVVVKKGDRFFNLLGAEIAL